MAIKSDGRAIQQGLVSSTGVVGISVVHRANFAQITAVVIEGGGSAEMRAMVIFSLLQSTGTVVGTITEVNRWGYVT